MNRDDSLACYVLSRKALPLARTLGQSLAGYPLADSQRLGDASVRDLRACPLWPTGCVFRFSVLGIFWRNGNCRARSCPAAHAQKWGPAVIIGNSESRRLGRYMLTPRGYRTT
ncbi:MAG: hypothetical protein LBV65_02900 [Desulfovibrio sp.]|nr:hypothetical protein [Desulfovibrio sp.]